MKHLLTAMVTDECGRDVPVVRELQSLPSPIAVWRKRVALPKRVRVGVMTMWIIIGYLGAAWCFVLGSTASVLLSIGVGLDDLSLVRELRVPALFWLSMPTMFLLGLQASWAWSGRHRAARLMAARGTCPSCTGSLLGAQEGPDGRVRCPGCQASWRLGTPEECPACRYDLSGAASVKDIITCPECAARWPAATEQRAQHEALAEFGHLTDDSGEQVPNRSTRHSKRTARALRTKDERERAGLLSWFMLLGTILGLWLLPGLVIVGIISIAARYVSEPTAQLVGMLLGWSLVGAVLPRWIRIMERSRIQTNRRLAICPACDADLHGAPADGDGLTPCPNCHARWNLPGSR